MYYRFLGEMIQFDAYFWGRSSLNLKPRCDQYKPTRIGVIPADFFQQNIGKYWNIPNTLVELHIYQTWFAFHCGWIVYQTHLGLVASCKAPVEVEVLLPSRGEAQRMNLFPPPRFIASNCRSWNLFRFKICLKNDEKWWKMKVSNFFDLFWCIVDSDPWSCANLQTLQPSKGQRKMWSQKRQHSDDLFQGP